MGNGNGICQNVLNVRYLFVGTPFKPRWQPVGSLVKRYSYLRIRQHPHLFDLTRAGRQAWNREIVSRVLVNQFAQQREVVLMITDTPRPWLRTDCHPMQKPGPGISHLITTLY